MSQLAIDVCQEGLTESLRKLFEFYSTGDVDVNLLCDESRSVQQECQYEEDVVSSTIELAGENVRYFICLVSTMETARQLCEGGADDAIDWIGELANQLFGRFKNHLLEYGVNAELGIPISAEGVQKKCVACGTGSATLEINTRAGVVWAIYKPQVDSTLQWTRNSDLAAAEEGSIQLF
ncbi:hypothetical protein U8335_08880 [Roseiconus lacunae]|uniref:hypothetical protein n=1 Tax=Roseiconus lacunae TaxID=2605694 RepID=UPI003084BCB6|nr:hypothetical protein U8335_08880 [Stieleria sp. HD01]